jgi:hypothetical protein
LEWSRLQAGPILFSLETGLLVTLFLRGSLVPGLLFHTFQNNEDTFEIVLAGLANTDWELVSTLGLLMIGILLAARVQRRNYSVEYIAQLVPGRP